VSASADSDAPGAERDALRRLEQAVGRALERIDELEEKLRASERRVGDLDQVLAGITGGGLEPSVLVDGVRALEEENAELRRRLAGGREGVERLLSKIRFLEEQR
jgi:predicted RNase H-like nuclease (RuvC/YqgF family)